ncbi:MAG: hypothetical protein HFJ41_01025 [Clostridia bacterium]|nr:hypothetical protein [Clostridia bacterium]
MKIFTKKGILQKTILVILTVLCINFIVPTYSQAGFISNVGGVLANALIDLCAMIGDAGASCMQWFMTGQFAAGEKFRDSAIMVEQGDNRIEPGNGDTTMEVNVDDLDLGKNTDGDTYQVPVIEYTPEEIFSNKVPYLDINFINPKLTKQTSEYKVDGTAAILQGTISGWYIALRNLAIVGLLCVLVYVGIRIIISSTAADKAKHKQMFMDWLIALCLLFFLHYIMSFTLVLIDSVNDAIAGNNYASESVVVSVSDGTSFTTNVMGAARFMIQSKDNMESFSYLILYIALIVYTGIFTYHYLRRVLTMAFLTIIAPLVALTYPIDKIGDGKAQAFNMWLKEYVYTALIQPFHLIIYMIFVGSAMELVKTNFIFALAAIAFILPAEKLLKKMFGFDKAPLGMMGALTGFTAASLATKFGGKGSSKGGSSGSSNKGGSTNKEENDKPRFERKHGTDGIDYRNNPNLDNSGMNGGLPSGENEDNNKNDEDSAAKKAAEAFAEQQRRQEEQERQRQLEEQQRQLAEEQEAIRKQQLEQEEPDKTAEQQRRMSEQKSDKESKEPGRFRQGIRNIANANGGKKGMALKGARTLGRAAKFTAKAGFGASRFALGAAGTVIGAAGGLASGKGIAGVIAGATAGRKIGTGVVNMAENTATGIGRTAVGVGRTIGNTGYRAADSIRRNRDIFNGNTVQQDKHTAKMFMKDASTDQYIRDKWTKDHNGQAPSAQQLRQEKQAIATYANEGMTDIAQIYRARKAENFGVDASQSAKIALLAQDRKIDSSVLGDDKKYKQRKEDFTQEFIDKGFSEDEAAKQADYVLNVMKAQVGQRHNLPKSGKEKGATKPVKPVEPTREQTNSSETNTKGSGTRNPRTNPSGGNQTGTRKPRTNPSGENQTGTRNPRTNPSGGNQTRTRTPRTTNNGNSKGTKGKNN